MIEEHENALNTQFNLCSKNIKQCWENNNILEYNIELIGSMLQEVKGVVSHKLFMDQ